MTEVIERISQAIGKTIRCVNVTLAEKRRALLAAGMPAEYVEALDEVFRERRKCSESRVDLSTHEVFGIQPTSFAEFARRNAAVFRDELALSWMLSRD